MIEYLIPDTRLYLRRHYSFKSYANTYRRRQAHGNSSRPSAGFKALTSDPSVGNTARETSPATSFKRYPPARLPPAPSPQATHCTKRRNPNKSPLQMTGDTQITNNPGPACLCFCNAGLGDLALVREREGRMGEACRSTGSGVKRV